MIAMAMIGIRCEDVAARARDDTDVLSHVALLLIRTYAICNRNPWVLLLLGVPMLGNLVPMLVGHQCSSGGKGAVELMVDLQKLPCQ